MGGRTRQTPSWLKGSIRFDFSNTEKQRTKREKERKKKTEGMAVGRKTGAVIKDRQTEADQWIQHFERRNLSDG